VRQRLHAEGVARDDPGHDRCESVIVVLGRAHNRAHLRHVEVLELAPERIHRELRRQRLRELIRPAQHDLPQRNGAVDDFTAR
jgi:hypothetical protein